LQLDRQDLIDGLRELVHLAHEQGITGVSIRIVGGAALRLAYFERATTADIDAQIEPVAQITPIIEEIALDRGWPIDWLNNEAVGFIPAWGQTVEWASIFDDEDVSISVAPIDALLAMKLNAARPGRDTGDIAKLLVLNNLESISDAEDLFESFYPGDALPERTVRLLGNIFESGLPPVPSAPSAVELD
jgi:hypothetical protein